MAADTDALSAASPLAPVVGAPTLPPELEALREAIATCTRCVLSETRTQTVFGSGSPTADLMFVGEAPGFHEDKQGIPFVGAAGKLLGKLLAEIGLTREDVFVANVLKCRPPGNRDPKPEEIASCESHLFRQIELIQPKVICTLGNFATKLLSGKPDAITKVHGQVQEVVLGGTRVQLFPIFHPAAALYTPRMLDVLKADFENLPALLGREPMPARVPEPAPQAPAPPVAAQPPNGAPSQPVATPEPAASSEPAIQLGLF